MMLAFSSTPVPLQPTFVLDIDVASFLPKHRRTSGHQPQFTLHEQHLLSVLCQLLLHTTHLEGTATLRPYLPTLGAVRTVVAWVQQYPQFKRLLPEGVTTVWQGLRSLTKQAPPQVVLTAQPRQVKPPHPDAIVLRILNHLEHIDEATLYGLSQRQRLLVSSAFCVTALEALMQNRALLKRPMSETEQTEALDNVFWYPFGLPTMDALRFMLEAPNDDQTALNDTEAWLQEVFEPPTEEENETPAYIITWAANDPEDILPGFYGYRKRFESSVLRLLVWSDSPEHTRRWADALALLPVATTQAIALVEIYSLERRFRLHQLAVACLALQTNPHNALLEILLALEARCPLITLNSSFHAEWVGDAGVAVAVGEPLLVFEALRQLLQEKPFLYHQVHRNALQQYHCWPIASRLQRWFEELPMFLH